MAFCQLHMLSGYNLTLASNSGFPRILARAGLVDGNAIKIDQSRLTSRPRVSDDNAFAEALFRTVKYRPAFPPKGFANLDAARQWAVRFVHWHNHEHRHGGIRYITYIHRYCGQDRDHPSARHVLYQAVRGRNPRAGD
jgi:transposase InsO family protein